MLTGFAFCRIKRLGGGPGRHTVIIVYELLASPLQSIFRSHFKGQSRHVASLSRISCGDYVANIRDASRSEAGESFSIIPVACSKSFPKVVIKVLLCILKMPETDKGRSVFPRMFIHCISRFALQRQLLTGSQVTLSTRLSCWNVQCEPHRIHQFSTKMGMHRSCLLPRCSWIYMKP